MTFHLPLPHLNLTINPEYGLWIGVLASSASLAAFLSSFLGKHSFITYKFVNYPAGHLKVLRFIRGNPRAAKDVALEFDIPLSVAQRVLEDLLRGGLLEKMGDGDNKTVYYFPFEKNLVKERN